MRLTVLSELAPLQLDPSAIIDKYQQSKKADPYRVETQPDSQAVKERPRSPGNSFTTSKQRHRNYFNMGPNSAAPEQKTSNGETGDGGGSKRPVSNNLGTPDRKEDWMDKLGIKQEPTIK